MPLHQNRIVIVGRNPQDAWKFSRSDRFRDELESPVCVSSSAHRLAILGGFPSHVGTVYVTADAPEGPSYPDVEEAIGRARERNPKLTVLEEPRTVHA